MPFYNVVKEKSKGITTLSEGNFWSVDLTLVINLHKKESQFGKIPNEKYFLYNVISFELSNFIFYLNNNVQFLKEQKLLKFLPGFAPFLPKVSFWSTFDFRDHYSVLECSHL